MRIGGFVDIPLDDTLRVIGIFRGLAGTVDAELALPCLVACRFHLVRDWGIVVMIPDPARRDHFFVDERISNIHQRHSPAVGIGYRFFDTDIFP